MDPRQRSGRRYRARRVSRKTSRSASAYAEELGAPPRTNDKPSLSTSGTTGLYTTTPISCRTGAAPFGKGDASAARATLDDLIRTTRFSLTRRTSPVRARARGGRQRTEFARGVRGSRALLPRRRSLVRLRAAAAAAGRRAMPQKVAREFCSRMRASRRDTMPGSSPCCCRPCGCCKG